MKKAFFLLVFSLLSIGSALAQDPGLPDSIIIGVAFLDSGATSARVAVYAVTDDSVTFYNLPLVWQAPRGGVRGDTGVQYFPPLADWDEHYDTVMQSESYFRMVGWADIYGPPNPPLFTQGVRIHILTLRYAIDSTAPAQTVVLDTTYDDRNGSVIFGLSDGITQISPHFERGFIRIGYPHDQIEEPNTPVAFNLSRNYPNPFNPSTDIDFALPSAQHVTLDVYNVLGQHVRTLINGDLEAGEYSSIWNGRDESGASAPSGIYFYKLTAGSFTDTRKMLMIK
jgi:hypothetical protein